MPLELAKTYAPKDVETQIAGRWTDAKAFAADPADHGDPYCIVIPPPNVTAALHMGHALNNTLQDILIRRERMKGSNAVWIPGTDHAGIATQTVVEKRVLKDEGKKRTDFKRDEFVAKIQAWKDEYEQTILGQLKSMGCSCDWDRTRFTMDPMCAAAVREAFFRLFRDGLIYRGKRLVNWDPATQTALADDEVEMKDVDGNFYYLRYPLIGPPLKDGSNFITVATTRPETMLGDTAVAINPKDPRAAELRGRRVLLPIVNRIIPIVEDDYVVLPVQYGGDPADSKAQFATGFLKVTPAHDPNDYEIGRRHNLAVINVFGPDGTISNKHGWPEGEWTDAWNDDPTSGGPNDAGFLLGKDRFAARKMIVTFFKEREMFEDIKPYKHSVGHSYRSHVPIEPYLSDQWYVRVTDARLSGAANLALAVGQRSPGMEEKRHDAATFPGLQKGWEGKLKFHPARYAQNYETWHTNIRDWCISRQLWWGHRIPVWSRPKAEGENYTIESVRAYLQKFVVLPAFGGDESRAREAMEGIACNYVGDSLFLCIRNFEIEQAIGESLTKMGYTQDPDVLDTWFSSALWPFSTLGWPNKTPELEKWNPGNVLCTAREIITLWVSRMVMLNLYLLDRVPFTDVFVHAMIQDGHGQKMSKSLGNGVDPLDIIHSHGSDAMRFTLASMTTDTQDVRMPVNLICPFTGRVFTPKYIGVTGGYQVAAPVQECPDDASKKFASSFGAASGDNSAAGLPVARNTSEKFDYGRNFANKLWNATRFALSNLEIPGPGNHEMPAMTVADHWILSRLAATVRDVDKALDSYQFSEYAQRLYDFIWRDLCDWYIEAIKPTVKDNNTQRKLLSVCIDASLRMLHPVMPFITEKLWEGLNEVAPHREVSGVALTPSALLIHASWPKVAPELIDTTVETDFDRMRAVVTAIREVRTANQIPPKQRIVCSAKAPSATAQRAIGRYQLVETLANVEVGEIGPGVEKPAGAAVTVVGDTELYLHGLVNADAEKVRLGKHRDQLIKDVAGFKGRLANKAYSDKAPAALVQQTRDQLAAKERELEAVLQQLAKL